MDRSTINKVQHQFWVTKQTVFRKLGKKEDECITASDAVLDAKLELFKSIQVTSSSMNKLLDRYQEKICLLAQEQNAMGRFLKEYGRQDKTNAGKMMIQMGKSLIYCSQQEISVRPALLRLYQEVETFRNRAVEDTLDTINAMERVRTEYRASLNWMKNVSQELDPDTCKQMEKFRKVQNHVKKSKAQFDKLKLACLQKVDLLAAARCNMFSHALIQYQNSMIKTTGKNAKVYNTLAITFKGHQYFEFSVVKELADPSRKLTGEAGGAGEPKGADDLLFDFNDEVPKETQVKEDKGGDSEDADMLGLDLSPAETALQTAPVPVQNLIDQELIASAATASELLDNLLGGGTGEGESPETESARDALDLDLGLFSPLGESSKEKEDSGSSSRRSISSLSLLGKSSLSLGGKKDKDKQEANDLLCDDLEGLNLENNDTMSLLNEILSAGNPNPLSGFSTLPELTSQPLKDQRLLADSSSAAPTGASAALLGNMSSQSTVPSSYLPSHLLDFSMDTGDLLGLSGASSAYPTSLPTTANTMDDLLRPLTSSSGAAAVPPAFDPNAAKSWYDIFADLDPIANPDAVGKKETDEGESRYC